MCVYSLLLSKIDVWGKYILEAEFERNWFQETRYSISFLFYNSMAITEVGDLNLDISIGSIGITNCYKTFYKGTLNICQIHFIFLKKFIMFHSCPSTLLLFTKYQPIDMKFRNFIFFPIKIFFVLYIY